MHFTSVMCTRDYELYIWPTRGSMHFAPIMCTRGIIIHMARVGRKRMYAPHKTVYLVISLPKTPYLHRIYMVMANLYIWPTHGMNYASDRHKHS